MRVLQALAFMPGVLAAGVASVPIDSRSLSEIYVAAQKEEGVLRVVHGGDGTYLRLELLCQEARLLIHKFTERNQADALFNAFAAKFPKVKVNHTVDLSKYLDGRINRAFQQGELYADMAILQTLQDYDAWDQQGVLLHYKPPSFDKVWPSVTTANGAYLPVFSGMSLSIASFSFIPFSKLRLIFAVKNSASFGPFIFNSSSIPESDIPKSYADILDPKWKGKIILTYPNDDDAVLYLFRLIIQQYGWSWLDALLTQDVQWVRGTATPAEVMLQDPSRILSFTTFPAAEGWVSVPPVSDHYMSWTQTSAIFKDTKMPETAKLLQAYLISEEYQLLRQGPSIRRDVGNVTLWDAKNTDYTSFHHIMEDRTVVEQWRFLLEDKLGTAQGLSPLIDNIN